MLHSLPGEPNIRSHQPKPSFEPALGRNGLAWGKSSLDGPALSEPQSRASDGAALDDRHFLFVTAPFGALSIEAAHRLRSLGPRVTRVLLNAGDVLDWGLQNAFAYRADFRQWPDWIARLMRAEAVSDLVVFGDSHPYAVVAMAAAKIQNVRIHVLEEGYFRPHWITLESDGVNGSSTLPRDPDFYRRHASRPVGEFVPVGKITPAAVTRITNYHVAQYLGSAMFPFYKTPNPYSPLSQAGGHVRRYWRQKLNAKRCSAELYGQLALSGPIFLALLQRPGDSQLLRHSTLQTMAAFIEKVVASFAAHAPREARLLFKAHPLDHGLEDHEQVIQRFSEDFGVGDRIFYTDSSHFPSLVRAAVGVVSVNSTGGLTSIEFQRPTATLGAAIYDMPGLTHQAGLDAFWTSPEAPDPELYKAFRRVVMAKTQINGAYSTSHGVRLAVPEIVRRLAGIDL